MTGVLLTHQILIVLITFVVASCDSDFASTPSFGDGGSKKKEAPQTGDANPILVGTPVERNNGQPPPDFANGEDYLQNVDALFGGEGNRDCNKEPLEDPEETYTVPNNGINAIVDTHCLTGMPGGSAVFNGEKEKRLLCNLLGFQRATSAAGRGWSSPGDNFTAQFEETGIDETTGLPKGKLINKPARSIPNTWLTTITCQGKLHDQCQYFKNEEGKIDCTGL